MMRCASALKRRRRVARFSQSGGDFVIEQEDLRGLSPEAPDRPQTRARSNSAPWSTGSKGAWLTRAKVFALPGRESLAAMSSAHMIADAGTRNIVLDEIARHSGPWRAAGRAVRCSITTIRSPSGSFWKVDQGAQLIDHWRRWYQDQPVMKAPSDGAPLQWGNGIRIVKNFTIPGRVLDKVRALAEQVEGHAFPDLS